MLTILMDGEAMRCDANERYTHAKKGFQRFPHKIFPPLKCVHTSNAAQQCLTPLSRVAIFLMIFSKNRIVSVDCRFQSPRSKETLHKSGSCLEPLETSVRVTHSSDSPTPQQQQQQHWQLVLRLSRRRLFIFALHPPRGASLTVSD